MKDVKHYCCKLRTNLAERMQSPERSGRVRLGVDICDIDEKGFGSLFVSPFGEQTYLTFHSRTSDSLSTYFGDLVVLGREGINSKIKRQCTIKV